MTTEFKHLKYLLYLAIFASFFFFPYSGPFLDYLLIEPNLYNNLRKLSLKPRSYPNKITVEPGLISADSYLVVDADTFTIISAYNENKKMAPASIVKLATALVSFEKYPLDKDLVVKTIINQPSTMGLVNNEKITVLNLLYGTLLNSANDAAYTLAENYPGGVTSFVREMNFLAKKYNLKNTWFANPIGFDDQGQYSTAKDLALLSREFIKNKILTNITATKSIVVGDSNFLYFHSLNNINELVGEIPHLGGLKTGTTPEAGQNLISYYTFDGHPLIIVVLKSADRFGDTRTLIDLINNNLQYSEIKYQRNKMHK